MAAKKRKTAKKTKTKKTVQRKNATQKKSAAKPKKTAAKKRTSRKTQARRFARLRFFGKWLFVLSVWAGIFLFGFILYYARDLPGTDDIVSVPARTGITILAHDGRSVGTYGGVRGQDVYADTLPAHLVNALLATEDRRFFSHFGLDMRGLARAFTRNLREGRISEGGSTITQQLAKNMFLSHDRTVKRKIQEALLALWLEQKFDKEEILTAYLNRVYFGAGAYGIDAAARTYFDKSAVALSLEESALLIGLLQAPSRYSPFSNPDLALRRTVTVLYAMADAGYLDRGQLDGVTAQNLPLRFVDARGDHADRHFMEWIADSIGGFVGTTGRNLVVTTTLDNAMQDNSAFLLRRMLDTHAQEKNAGEAAFLALSPDGAVRAMVGGRDYAQSRFNRAVQAERQPGSAFKPFIYLAALLQGMDVSSVIDDAPLTPEEAGGYTPENFAGRYYGPVTLEDALAFSLNTAAVRLMRRAGIGHVIAAARKAGITSEMRRDLSLALGSSEVTLMELTAAYAVFANGGFSVYPYAVLEIRDDAGQILYSRDAPEIERVFPARIIRRLDVMLETVVTRGTGRAAAVDGARVRGKTGTSQNARDAWFIGYTEDIVAGLWMGNDDGRPMTGVTGGTLPAQLWAEIIGGSDLTDLRYRPPTAEGEGIGGLLRRMFGGEEDGGASGFRGDNTERFN